MDKETQDALNKLTTLVEGIQENMTTKQDLESIKVDMATKQDFKELKDELRKIVREEVQDIRDDMERRCSPAQTEN